MKKAQVNMAETVIVIFIFVVLLGLFLIYYTQFRSEGIEQEAKESKTASSTALLSVLSSVPEIKCSEKAKEEQCIDTLKVLALNSIIAQNINYYRSVFGTRDISLEILYPISEQKAECNQQSYKNINYPSNCNEYIIFSSITKTANKNIISTPVSIYFPETDTFGIGKLKIITYTR